VTRQHLGTVKDQALMGKFDWLDQLASLPLDRSIKLVGFALAHYANKDGKSCRPGLNRLMWTCGIRDERTVGNAVKELRRLHLIWLHKAGGGRPAAGYKPLADEYWLTTHPSVKGWALPYDRWLKERSA
jgi:hypothetical protein